jgi:ankyrin repeat protein
MPRIREDWFEAERLIQAAQGGDLLEAQRLSAEGFDLNLMDEIGKGALHYAVEGENYKLVTWLLDIGAKVDLHNDEIAGETALSLAARRNYPELVELLLKHGADPDVPGLMQQTARMRAHQRRDTEGLKIAALIEQYKPTPPNPCARHRK